MHAQTTVCGTKSYVAPLTRYIQRIRNAYMHEFDRDLISYTIIHDSTIAAADRLCPPQSGQLTITTPTLRGKSDSHSDKLRYDRHIRYPSGRDR